MLPKSSGGIHFEPAPPAGMSAAPGPPATLASRVPAAAQKDETMPKIEMQALQDQLVDGGGRFAAGPRGIEGKEGHVPGTKFHVTSEEEAAALVARGLAERVSPPPAPEGEEASDAEVAADAPWTLGMEPDAYLAKYGDDKKYSKAAHAELARRAAAEKK